MVEAKKFQTGFTIIEVMVALAILAVVAVAANQASSGYLRTVQGMKTRTLAHFVAENAGARLAIEEGWLTSVRQEQVSEQGRNWQITYTPTIPTNMPKSMPQSISQQLQSVDINVMEVIDSNGGNKTGTGSAITVVLTKPD